MMKWLSVMIWTRSIKIKYAIVLVTLLTALWSWSWASNHIYTQNCGLRMRRECRELFPRHPQRFPRASDPDMYHGTCMTHVPWCIPGSLNSHFLWRQWRGKRSRRMRKPQFCVSGRRPMVMTLVNHHHNDIVKWAETYPVTSGFLSLGTRGWRSLSTRRPASRTGTTPRSVRPRWWAVPWPYKRNTSSVSGPLMTPWISGAGKTSSWPSETGCVEDRS